MTILRSGTTQQYSDNWSQAFGKATGGSKTKKAGTKSLNKKKKTKKKNSAIVKKAKKKAKKKIAKHTSPK